MNMVIATSATSGIRVNAVAPGLVDTPMSRSSTSSEVAQPDIVQPVTSDLLTPSRENV